MLHSLRPTMGHLFLTIQFTSETHLSFLTSGDLRQLVEYKYEATTRSESLMNCQISLQSVEVLLYLIVARDSLLCSYHRKRRQVGGTPLRLATSSSSLLIFVVLQCNDFPRARKMSWRQSLYRKCDQSALTQARGSSERRNVCLLAWIVNQQRR